MASYSNRKSVSCISGTQLTLTSAKGEGETEQNRDHDRVTYIVRADLLAGNLVVGDHCNGRVSFRAVKKPVETGSIGR